MSKRFTRLSSWVGSSVPTPPEAPNTIAPTDVPERGLMYDKSTGHLRYADGRSMWQNLAGWVRNKVSNGSRLEFEPTGSDAGFLLKLSDGLPRVGIGTVLNAGFITIYDSLGGNARQWINQAGVMLASGNVDVPALNFAGINGATVGTRIVGAKTSTPTSGVLGDMYFNTTDLKFYRCTVTGTPGTWVAIRSAPALSDLPAVPHLNLTLQATKTLAVPNNVWTVIPFDTEATDIENMWTAGATTTIAAGSNGAALPQGTINVADSSAFPSTGYVSIDGPPGANVVTTVQYTGKGAGTLTGCTGGTGTMATGQTVRFIPSPLFANGGVYDYKVHFPFATNATGVRAIQCWLGLFAAAEQSTPAHATAGILTTQTLELADSLQVTAANKATTAVHFRVFQNSGGVLNSTASILQIPRLQMTWVGRASDGV